MSVDLDALPSMLSSDDDMSESDDDIVDRGDRKLANTTDVDGLD